MSDTNFDGRAAKFAKNIYGTTKGQVREGVLWHLLQQQLLPSIDDCGRILDAGGGQGQMAFRLAAIGHEVVLTDVSEQMLAIAKRTAVERQLEQQVRFVQGPIQQLDSEQLGLFDGILCHAVLEWVTDIEPVLAQLNQHLKPGGRLSLAFFNHTGAEMHNLVAGNFDNVGSNMTAKKTKRVRLVPQNPLHNHDVIAACEALGFVVEQQAGVRVIHDYLRDKSMQQTQLSRLLELEIEYCQKPVYRDIGRYTHLLLRKPN